MNFKKKKSPEKEEPALSRTPQKKKPWTPRTSSEPTKELSMPTWKQIRTPAKKSLDSHSHNSEIGEDKSWVISKVSQKSETSGSVVTSLTPPITQKSKTIKISISSMKKKKLFLRWSELWVSSSSGKRPLLSSHKTISRSRIFSSIDNYLSSSSMSHKIS